MFFRNLISAFICFIAFNVNAEIIETRYIDDVLPLIDEETWFLIDLDNCMFEGTEALGHANWFYDELGKRMSAGLTREDAIADFYPHWIKTQEVSNVKPLEDHFVSGLLTLQSKGITIMGLTHRQPPIAHSTVRQVKSLGFDFFKTAPFKKCFSLPAKTPTLYIRGILFVGDYNRKIDVFETFLFMIKKTPSKVVFIDDKRKNVEELEAITKHGIVYTGVHYTAIDYAHPIYDPEIAYIQSVFFECLGQILTNEEAFLMMINNSK